jgi:protein subunit release factor B
MDGDVVTPSGIVIPAGAIGWRFSRGTGPGGQGVNTTDSRVELVVDLTALVTSNEVADRVPALQDPRGRGGGRPRQGDR